MEQEKENLWLKLLINLIIWIPVAIILILIIGIKNVNAKQINWAYVRNDNTNTTLYDTGANVNINQLTYSGGGNNRATSIDIQYLNLNVTNAQTIYFSGTYRFENTPKAKIELNVWYKDTNGSWHGVQDLCSTSINNENISISCTIYQGLAINGIIIRFSFYETGTTNRQLVQQLKFYQQYNTIDIQNNSSLGGQIPSEINANADKNANNIIDAINAQTEFQNKCQYMNRSYPVNDWNKTLITDNTSSRYGELGTRNGYNTTTYIDIQAIKEYTITLPNITGLDTYIICKYNHDKFPTECIETQNNTVTINGAEYIKYSAPKEKLEEIIVQGNICYNIYTEEGYYTQFEPIGDGAFYMQEGQMLDSLDSNLQNNINVNIDTTANTIIWSIINRILQENTIIFTMTITLLSLGIIRMVLGK